MNYDQLVQTILLTQDAKQIGWDFVVEGNKLKAVDGNFNFDPVVFQGEEQLLEWLEEQFDRETL